MGLQIDSDKDILDAGSSAAAAGAEGAGAGPGVIARAGACAAQGTGTGTAASVAVTYLHLCVESLDHNRRSEGRGRVLGFRRLGLSLGARFGDGKSSGRVV